MEYEKNITCPFCHSKLIIKKGKRRGKIRLKCCECEKWFQINRTKKRYSITDLVIDHLDGHSFRTLSRRYNLSVGTVYNKVINYLDNLPHIADITRTYCSHFSNILLVDGTFIGINSLKRKVPIIYGIDYKTHDIPTFKLSQSESFLACREFFVSCNLAGYPLSMLVCDDNRNIYEACQRIYRHCHHQLCHNHFKQNIKLALGFSSHNKTHFSFIKEINSLLGHKLSRDDFNARATRIIKYYSFEPKYVQIMLNIAHNQDKLLAFHHHKGTPITNNLIESYNKHLKSRLKSICYFQDSKHARLWINGYFLYRRTKIFTDCKGKFRYLNGKTSLSLTKKSEIELPMFF